MAEDVGKLIALMSIVGLPVAVVLFLLFLPEKIEKWSALLWRFLSMFGGLFKSAHKRYVKHDLQARVNGFVGRLRKQAPGIGTEKLKIEYVEAAVDRRSFIADGNIVIRLKRDDPHDHNFVHGVYHYVSHALLPKAKRYLSPSQREAVDLYVCTKIIEAEKPAVVGFFLDEYLHPRTADGRSRVSTYVDDFSRIDGGGLFFPVLVQELQFLGDKVFGRRRDDLVHTEVNQLIAFLRPIAERVVGAECDLNYHGSYCRFGIVIVGKPQKLQWSIEPYVGYIRKVLVNAGAETIYLLSRPENRSKVDEICQRFSEGYECQHKTTFRKYLRHKGMNELAVQYLVVLRKKGIQVIQPSVAVLGTAGVQK